MARKRHATDSIKDEVSANHRPVKKARNYTEEDAKLAKIYDNLSNEVGEKRIRASAELVKKLFDSNHPQKDHTDEALKRLIRGLCSGRKAARLGFSVALTEVLRQILVNRAHGLQYKAADIFKLINSITKFDRNLSGQEKRDYLLGRVFNYKALVQSKALFEHVEESYLWHDVVGQICQLAVEYQWLREECGLILHDAVKITSEVKNANMYIEKLISVLCQKKLHQTPQGVAIWLSVREENPDLQLPKGFWHHQNPLSSKENSHLATVMREDYSQTSDGAKGNASLLKSGMSLPQISFAWDIIITHMTHDANMQHDKMLKRFSKFWKEVVDNNLFSDTASLERKAWGFQVFSRAMQLLPEWALPIVFSPRLMKCIINHRIDSKRYLYSASKISLETIQSRARSDPSTTKLFICQLTGPYGAVNFDELTQTKTVEDLFSTARPEVLLEITFYLAAIALKPNADNQSEAEFQRRIVADLFLSLLRRHYKNQESLHNLAINESWLKELLTLLIKYAYFRHRSGNNDFNPEPEISEASRSIFRTRLFSCLTYLTEKRANENDIWIGFVLSQIREIQETDSSVEQNFTDDNDVLLYVRHCHKFLDEFFIYNGENKDLDNVVSAFRLLYSLTLLQLYNGESDASTTIEDLESSFKVGPQKLETDSRAVIVLVDIILSILSRSSTLSRIIATRCFTALTYTLTEYAILSLFEILKKPENALGQDDLYAEEESADELGSEVDFDEASRGSTDFENNSEARDNDDGEEAHKDRVICERIDGRKIINDDDNEVNDDSDADTSPSSSQESDENDEELSKFNSLLANVLQVPAKEKASEQDESSTESDMDDDQMMALESHLTNIFKERKKIASRKREQKDAKETMIAFKNRVLDLLLVYIRKQHANPLSITLVLPLLRLVRTSSSKQLAEKAFSHLKQYYDICKSRGIPAYVSDETLWEILRDIHIEAAKSTSKMTASASSRSSLFVAKILVAKDSKNYDGLVEQYASTQKSWYMDSKSKVNPTMFTEWISWSIGTRMRP